MSKIITLITAIFFTGALLAQPPSGMAPRMGGMSLHVFGKVVDSAGKPVSAASVVLLKSTTDSSSKKRNTLIKSIVAASNGDFSFEDVNANGALLLKISAVGFEPFDQQVPMMNGKPGAGMPSSDKDLGNIKLKSSEKYLQAVVVTAPATGLKMDIDKKTFNVEKNIVTEGGTAVDVMRNVPSVQVDIDGNVKLRNAAPQIYVDGRPTTLTLDEIPADAIQSVEVITNPSAKYDASGGNAGILNIVLKKNKKSGYNGSVMTGADSRGGYNFGGNFNARQGKINFTAAAMANHNKNHATGTTDRYIYGTDPSHVFQDNEDKSAGTFVFGRLGMDYYVTNRTTLSLSGVHVQGNFDQNSAIKSDSLNESNSDLLNYNIRSTTGSRSFNAWGLQSGFVHNYKKDGEQLTGDANYFSGIHKSNSYYTTDYYDNNNAYTGNFVQNQLSSGDISFLTLQTDYVNPFSATTKLEAGLRAQMHKLTNNTNNYNGDSTGTIGKIPSVTNDYKNNDNVYAAYASFTSAIKKFGYQIGLRAESSNYKGYVTNTGQEFKNNYPLSFFPSVFLSQKLNHNQEVQLNYSRRINRPNFFQLIPYTDSTDLSNITRGNPNLVPEFTNSFEASYSKTFKGGNSLLFSVYYKHSSHLITRFLDSSYDSYGNLYLINTYVNASSSYNYGAELTSINNIAKWWDVTTNLNLYESHINVSNLNTESQPALLSWFGKLNNNFKIPKNFVIQLSADYQSKANVPVTQQQQQMGPPGMQAQSSSQGYVKSFCGVDIALRKSFLKQNKASVTLSMNDIFRTRANEQISKSAFFYQDYYRLNNPQLLRLNFSYRFGKTDATLFKRQNTKSSGSGDAMQMAQ